MAALREAKANNVGFWECARSQRGRMAGRREDLNNLPPGDKKLLVESLVPGKIPVDFEFSEEGKPEWFIPSFPFSFNTAILERFIIEGKLKRLTQNDRDHRFVQVL
jgi:hypothetical protein